MDRAAGSACFTAAQAVDLRERHADPQPDCHRPARRRQQLRHRSHRARRQRRWQSRASASWAATTRPRAARAFRRPSETSSPSTTWPTRWVTSSPATTRSTAPSANCSGGNRNAGTSVEPGSGSSVMAYAGICQTDNLQPHSDPYWSQRSFDEIVTYTSGADDEHQRSADGRADQLHDQRPVVPAAVQRQRLGRPSSAERTSRRLESRPRSRRSPAGRRARTATVTTLGDTAFTITFGGTLANTNVNELQLVNCTGGCTGFVGEIAKGGLTTRNGTVTPTGNNFPVVTAPASYTIPIRTPFVLTGSATDPDGDTVTYMWEQNDRGAAAGTSLISNTKTNGPLFRQFGTRAVVSASGHAALRLARRESRHHKPDASVPGHGADPGQQHERGNGELPGGLDPADRRRRSTASRSSCRRPRTSGFAGDEREPALAPLQADRARRTRRHQQCSDDAACCAPPPGRSWSRRPTRRCARRGFRRRTVTWSVANTNIAPVSAANVKITLSADGGNTYPYTLAASTPNNGSASVTLAERVHDRRRGSRSRRSTTSSSTSRTPISRSSRSETSTSTGKWTAPIRSW